MAALVTLAQAVKHLRGPAEEEYDDLELKIQQASGIILDYLKSRANKTATISTSSVAASTVITTAAAHGFLVGETVTITGHVDSTPALDGTYVISAVTTLTFTVPLTVTVAGTGGTADVEWTPDTVPLPVQAATLLMLTHLHEHRGDDQESDEMLWKAIERLVIRFRDPAFA